MCVWNEPKAKGQEKEVSFSLDFLLPKYDTLYQFHGQLTAWMPQVARATLVCGTQQMGKGKIR